MSVRSLPPLAVTRRAEVTSGRKEPSARGEDTDDDIEKDWCFVSLYGTIENEYANEEDEEEDLRQVIHVLLSCHRSSCHVISGHVSHYFMISKFGGKMCLCVSAFLCQVNWPQMWWGTYCTMLSGKCCSLGLPWQKSTRLWNLWGETSHSFQPRYTCPSIYDFPRSAGRIESSRIQAVQVWQAFIVFLQSINCRTVVERVLCMILPVICK